MLRTDTYWQDKLSLWLHDPVCKVFDIPHHEQIASEIAELLNQSKPTKDVYQAADCIAASLTRSILPSYADGGGITFSSENNPQITHPLVQGAQLPVQLPSIEIDRLLTEIKQLLIADLGLDKTYEELQHSNEAAEKPLNAYFDRTAQPEQWAQALFNYLFFAFQRRLRIKNVGNLGALWDILPADTRMPDHPLWHHLGLVSAIGSCLTADPQQKINLVVFSITPVQDFIAKARKLRDYWTGSVLLSYLSFRGIAYIMEEMGPDHIIYPSLHNQPLVDSLLHQRFRLGDFLKEIDTDLNKLIENAQGIAAFPNKFVFLCAESAVHDTCEKLSQTIQHTWETIAETVKRYVSNTVTNNNTPPKDYNSESFAKLWNTQIEDFWKYAWASAKVAELSDKDTLESLLSGKTVATEYDVLNDFSSGFQTKTARLYASSHALVQSMLAAGKMKPEKVRRPQHGEKCPLCGEREVLHGFAYSGIASAKEYSTAVRLFWDTIRNHANPNSASAPTASYTQIGEHERLCAVCTVKRLLPFVLKAQKPSSDSELFPLWEIFKDAERFPSTTEIAAGRFCRKLERFIHSEAQQASDTTNANNGKQSNREVLSQDLITYLHNADLLPHDIDELSTHEQKFVYDATGLDEQRLKNVQQLLRQASTKGISFTDTDKYYAVLLMDGDKMGDLINGATIEACWKDVLHSDLMQKIVSGQVQSDVLKRHLDERRIMNPALHAMISDSLNNFARFGVQPAMDPRKQERLIYAGGDDVCAVLPLDSAVQVAYRIQRAYRVSFSKVTQNGAQEITQAQPDMKKIGLHLGHGAAGISLSGAIVIAHHKQPLREVIKAAHLLLDGVAKEKMGRNALAIRLSKRSGGDRDFAFKWDAPNPFADGTIGEPSVYAAFLALRRAVTEKKISASLLYKLQDLTPLFEPLLNTEHLSGEPLTLQDVERTICRLLAYELKHSGISLEDTVVDAYARNLAGVCFRRKTAPLGQLAGQMHGGSQAQTAAFEFVPEAAIIVAFWGSALCPLESTGVMQ